MVKIIKPSIGGHDGSSFRELLDMWSERGYCTIEQGPSQRSEGYTEDPDSPEAKCWVEEQGNVLLYDFPILDRLKNEYKQCLFSNTYKEGKGNKKWIFWPKHSRLYDQMKGELRRSLDDRKFFSGFIGAPTNHHRNAVAHDWSRVCEAFRFSQEPIQHDEYLQFCSNFKFGVSLRGVGPKCLRDIEYIGMGTVPVFSPGVSVDYHNPLVEDVHFLKAETPEEAADKMKSLTKEQWTEMSNACIEWFEENCSVDGSFKTTMEIIND
jgi:hypothetical protein